MCKLGLSEPVGVLHIFIWGDLRVARFPWRPDLSQHLKYVYLLVLNGVSLPGLATVHLGHGHFVPLVERWPQIKCKYDREMKITLYMNAMELITFQ